MYMLFVLGFGITRDMQYELKPIIKWRSIGQIRDSVMLLIKEELVVKL